MANNHPGITCIFIPLQCIREHPSPDVKKHTRKRFTNVLMILPRYVCTNAMQMCVEINHFSKDNVK